MGWVAVALSAAGVMIAVGGVICILRQRLDAAILLLASGMLGCAMGMALAKIDERIKLTARVSALEAQLAKQQSAESADNNKK